MKKRICTILACVCLLAGNIAYADGISVSEMTQTSPAEDTNVKVVKYVDDEEVILYTGPVSQYDNGICSGVDFSKSAFIVLLEWENPDAVYYVYPIETGEQNLQMSSTTQSIEENSSQHQTNLSVENDYQDYINFNYEQTTESANEQFVIKDAILENENNRVNSLQNATVLSKVVIANKQTNEISPVIFAALYDDGRLADVKMMDATQNDSANSVMEYTLNMPLTNISENMTLKITTWDGTGTIKPYAIPLNIYYGYSIDVSTVLNQEYTIPIITNTSASKFKVTYDNDFFVVKDLCRDADDIVTEIGIINNEITINEITQSSFTFTVNTENKCVNCVVLRALKSGNTAIKIEEILE